MFNRAITIFLGKDNCHYTTKEKQTGTATLDDKSQVQFLSKKNPKIPFFYSRRNLYMIGFLLAFIVTLLEFIRGRHQNFMVFSDATQFFWQGISPYTTEFVEAHGRYFLYSPVFTYCSLRLRICLHGWDLSRGIYSIIRCSLWRSSRCPNNSPSSRNAVCSFFCY